MLLAPYLTHRTYFKFVPSFIDESAAVGEESAVDRIEDREFAQSLDGKEQHGTDDHKTNELEQAVSYASIAISSVVAITYHTARATVMK